MVQLMEENRIDKKVYSDLLATEFARKFKQDDSTLTDTRCYILDALLS